MKTPNAERVATSRGAKDKKQIIVLGGLMAVLGVVLFTQFSGEDEAASATTTPALDTAVGGIQESADRIGEAESLVSVPDNEALSTPSEDSAVRSSPFESFWSVDAPVETTIEQIPPPSITLNGTLASDHLPIAIIDGQTRYVNDMVQGWRLVSIGSREVGLESPSKDVITVAMPLLKVTNRRNP